MAIACARLAGPVMIAARPIVQAVQSVWSGARATNQWIHRFARIVRQDGWVLVAIKSATKTMVNRNQWTLANASVKWVGPVPVAIQNALVMVRSRMTSAFAFHCKDGVANCARFQVVQVSTRIVLAMVNATQPLLLALASTVGLVLDATSPTVQVNQIATIVVSAMKR